MQEFKPRPKQAEILAYQRGYMGIAAVPGSGKTWTLSRLAVEIIRSNLLADGQEVLIVTLVNSAVDNFAARIGEFIQGEQLMPRIGYRVRTLHGLAHDIVRRRPDLLNLDENFQIVDELDSVNIVQDASRAWLREHPEALDPYLIEDVYENEQKKQNLYRSKIHDHVSEVSWNFIKLAKDKGLNLAHLNQSVAEMRDTIPLAAMCIDIYGVYQRALEYRGAVDFSDLIRMADEALTLDESYLAYFRDLWPYILEDEAQDSSLMQERILEKLAGVGGNWVRVGDPNQAIFETFTTADPDLLRNFIANKAGFPRELPNSGRSTESIINLANELIRWVMQEHPIEDAREALSPPPIEPTPPGDPQPNPPDKETFIYFDEEERSLSNELDFVAQGAGDWIEEHPEDTLAVLVPAAWIGQELVELLEARELPYTDTLLKITYSTRKTVGAMTHVLNHLANPKDAKRLANAYKAWRRDEQENVDTWPVIERIAKAMAKLPSVEDLVWPGPSVDALDGLSADLEDEDMAYELEEFRRIVRRWQGAVLLPVDQLILTVGQDLFTAPSELALVHKVALDLRRSRMQQEEWSLSDAANELKMIATRKRRGNYTGFGDDDREFDPQNYAGKICVATMHKAKGLEWDRVHLVAVSNYDFPSGQPYDYYRSRKWFWRDELDLQAEAEAQLENLLKSSDFDWKEEGEGTQEAQMEYVKERLRLFYVGITRAKKELVVTWNTGSRGDNRPAAAFTVLRTYLENHP